MTILTQQTRKIYRSCFTWIGLLATSGRAVGVGIVITLAFATGGTSQFGGADLTSPVHPRMMAGHHFSRKNVARS